MKIIKGKYCQKCGSKNIYLEYDMGRWYEHCLICGYTTPLEEIEQLKPVKEDEASWPDELSFKVED